MNQLNQSTKNKLRPKLAYHSPQLKKYGKLKDMTLGGSGGGTDGAAGLFGPFVP